MVTPRSRDAISLSVNDGYVWHALRLLRSLRRNWRNHPDVLIQHGGLTSESQALFSGVPGVQLCLPADTLEGPPINLAPGADTRATYLRLNLWNDVADYERILYLDADTIVLKPLDDLMTADGFVMFTDHTADTLGMFIDAGNRELQNLLTEDGVTLGAPMANAGVFVMPRRSPR